MSCLSRGRLGTPGPFARAIVYRQFGRACTVLAALTGEAHSLKQAVSHAKPSARSGKYWED